MVVVGILMVVVWVLVVVVWVLVVGGVVEGVAFGLDDFF